MDRPPSGARQHDGDGYAGLSLSRRQGDQCCRSQREQWDRRCPVARVVVRVRPERRQEDRNRAGIDADNVCHRRNNEQRDRPNRAAEGAHHDAGDPDPDQQRPRAKPRCLEVVGPCRSPIVQTWIGCAPLNRARRVRTAVEIEPVAGHPPVVSQPIQWAQRRDRAEEQGDGEYGCAARRTGNIPRRKVEGTIRRSASALRRRQRCQRRWPRPIPAFRGSAR